MTAPPPQHRFTPMLGIGAAFRSVPYADEGGAAGTAPHGSIATAAVRDGLAAGSTRDPAAESVRSVDGG